MRMIIMKTLRTLYIGLVLALLPALALAQGNIIYVDITAKGAANGSSWSHATTLESALTKAKMGDKIWMRGYAEANKNSVYVAPQGGFELKSGVQLYGGFSGTEQTEDDREVVDGKAYRMRYRTVLTGDRNRDDTKDDTNLIFPANKTRGENATHVLTLNMEPVQASGNNNTATTVVDGLTIARGHAVNANGGGILVTGNNAKGGVYIIRRCFFIENYAAKGGALYVEANVIDRNNDKCLIDRCGFFNNAAGNRAESENAGGAIWLDDYAAGTIVNTAIFNNENGGVYLGSTAANVRNSTIVRNTGTGADSQGGRLYNTVIWGNSRLTGTQREDMFNNCAYPEAEPGTADSRGNIHLAERNNDTGGPHFDSPSIRTGFDRDYNIQTTLYPLWTWMPLANSGLIDKGDDSRYDENAYGTVDLDGNQRQRGTIDIGAFEYQPVSASRRRYVKSGGTGDGTSWDDASGDLQRMIDELADNNPNGQPGEVWVAAGTYEPQAQLIPGTSYSSSFRMRDGVSVYGGFEGNETSLAERNAKKGAMPWSLTNETELVAAYYDHDNLAFNNNTKWTLTSDSRHVVWFAPLGEGDGGFTQPTYLDGVTIRGGYAQGGTGLDEFMTDRGAGVYMDGENTYLTNCIVKENYAKGNGGGVYVKEGRVQTSLIYNNNSDANGGAVYVDDQGLVHRSMLANNSARNGAGAYLDNADGATPEYLILSTCVVSNNTTTGNAAVYCNRGGVLLQNTVVNNNCVTGTDLTDPNASRTGGIYVNEYGLVVNSVIWNNHMGTSSSTNVPMYAKNPTAEKVRFLYNAISGVNNSIWNNTRQEQTLSLVDKNAGQDEVAASIGPRFEPLPGTNMASDNALESKVGVQSDWNMETDTAIDYYWEPVHGSNLWARGMPIGQLPQEVVLAPEIDIKGGLFAQKPAVGAFHVDKSEIVPSFERSGSNYKLVVYIDADCTEPDHYGTNWEEAYRSLNDAIAFCASLSGWIDGKIDNIETSIPIANIDSLEIRVLEGDLWPRYAFVNEDPKTATLDILKMLSGKPLKIVGGYYRTTDRNTAERDPLNHRSVLNGNSEGGSIKNGLYHVVTVEQGAQVELDGFHIVNGYAAGTATLQYGAGLLAHAGADVTLTNCIFENNTAANGAAIYAAEAASLAMRNCVVNNNTNTVNTNSVIVSPSKFTPQHVTVVNNLGAALGNLGGTSFAVGNSSGNSTGFENFATIGAEGAKNFANPTNKVGAPENVGYDTYLGGYSSFRPLTSSDAAGTQIINQAQPISGYLSTDITTQNDRDLGGVPDLGAYEAELPKAGRVYYVRTDGDDSKDGLSWGTAFATISKAMQEADKGDIIDGEKPQVWVAAGTYSQDPQNGSDNCFEILDAINVYGAFPATGNPSMDDRHPFISTSVYHDGTYDPADFETILQPQKTSGNSNRRVLGQADEYNPLRFGENEPPYKYELVGEGKGNFIYRQNSEYIYVGKGKGDYYLSENGGEYVSASKELCDYLKVEQAGYYETTSKTPTHKYAESYDESAKSGPFGQTKYFVKVGNGKGEYYVYQQGWSNRYTERQGGGYSEFTGAGYYEAAQGVATHSYCQVGEIIKVNKGQGNLILTTQGYNNVGQGYGDYQLLEAGYVEVPMGEGNYIRTAEGVFTYGATWDGFTLSKGRVYSNLLTEHINGSVARGGGAGAAIYFNVTLQNCVITENENTSNASGTQTRGGGVYCDGGSLVNCYIINNTLGRSDQYTAYGGGCYMYRGTAYNCVISKNQTKGYNGDGAGIFIENAEFYNNTIVDNKYAGSSRGNGGICIWTSGASSHLTIYNCIVLGNSRIYGDMTGSGDIAVSTNGGYIDCYYSITSDVKDATRSNGAVTYHESQVRNTSIFADYTNGNYRLMSKDGTNMGIDAPVVNGKTIDLSGYTDMDFTDRIKDCRVDAGAYERVNIDNIEFEDGYNQTTGKNRIVYYVTQNGAGSMSGGSLGEAACAEKLQIILDAAGEQKRQNPGYEVIVKVAGYEDFVYNANTLVHSYDPQSYSYEVPYGVVLEGGYNDQADDWNDAASRNAFTYSTKLSAVHKTLEQDVNGYHAVTFGEKPEGWPTIGDNVDVQTVVDGVWLVDGSATSMSGDGANTMGGGAIVSKGAHVRNCVVQDCSAVRGGGLYVMPGGTVSGTVVMGNTADYGGGIYADNGDTESGDKVNRAHIISCTIADNTADDGGGLYLEDGAAMSVNTVIWGNDAPQGKNVSGVTGQQFPDDKLADAYSITEGEGRKTSFFPFNDCFVESLPLPSDFINTTMQSEADVYFANVDETNSDYRLKELSPLIKHGAEDKYFDGFVAQFNIAESDMQGNDRNEEVGRIDAGAFAFPGGILPNELFTRIFVSQGSNVKLHEEKKMLDYLGRSFYTSFPTLEDALSYIRKMRHESKLATNDTPFEILIAHGTYTPTGMREDAAQNVAHDQRLYSFEVPQNVSIYGGFSGTEDYSTDITEIVKADGTTLTLVPDGEIKEILTERKFSDFNGNGIEEPWELEQQTILSGAINASTTAKNAYHVLFSKEENVKEEYGVMLDGLTIMDGETWNSMTTADQHDEAGRGGGLYSYGVPYTISRCRFQNNFGVRGGAVYVRDARLNIVGSIFAGNGTVDDAATGSEYQPARGGAIFMASSMQESSTSLYAANSLFVNNGTDETVEGGAIATNYPDGQAADYAAPLDIINCTFAKNKAQRNGVIYNDNGKSVITNTLMWGNEGEPTQYSSHVPVTYSASDVDYFNAFGDNNSGNNILLDKGNTDTNGPRFTNPATVAGVAGNDATNLWNPVAMSVATDKGNGTQHTDTQLEGEVNEHYPNTINGDYAKWFVGTGIAEVYMGGTGYSRYSGPRNAENKDLCKPIDIGFYEYQYVSNFQAMPAIYVATERSGDGSGNGWNNATDDLRGAIIGASNPTEKGGSRTIYVRDGDYSWNRNSGGNAFVLNMNVVGVTCDSLTIKGSCTGIGEGDNAQQDFDKPTVIRNNDAVTTTTNNLLSVSANAYDVRIEGVTFINREDGQNGVTANAGTDGSFTLANSAFRGNGGTGLNISGNSGKVLIYNTLFADGGTGLVGDAHTTLVNNTFANNNTDMTGVTANVYNTVSWNNETENLPEGNNNKKFGSFANNNAAQENNDDISNGPNFVDPLNADIELCDYHIRPSLTLLNQGDSTLYAREVLGNDGVALAGETDLGNNARVTDSNIDIGAYEYEAPLQPIVYVKADVVNPDGIYDGKSWGSALDDLQGAADLVGIYAYQHEGENGYVFVHNNVRERDVRLTLFDTKVYGGMADETTVELADNYSNVADVVAGLLDKRAGLIERAGGSRSTLRNVTVSGVSSVVDGFEVGGNVNLGEGGYLSTSIVNGGATLGGNGVLYNSLVYGDVPEGIKTVNVTATGTVQATNANFNNRSGATADNEYVKDGEWAYQLNETSADIDAAGSNNDETKTCQRIVGHERDIAGNTRIRNNVDNGCFETWNIVKGDAAQDADGKVIDEDYPHGKSVVYVRSAKSSESTGSAEGAELVIEKKYTADNPFNPGVLLLEHRAGLRVVGNGSEDADEYGDEGNNVGLSYVIVEREVEANGEDMAYAPFRATIDKPDGVTLKYYDAAERAKYDYKFDDGGGAWKPFDITSTAYDGSYGLLLDNTAGAAPAKVRFVGKGTNVYTEGKGIMKTLKEVVLQKNNYWDPWTSTNQGTGNKFTAKENMSWNLFGSPYLCAMNYEDMEYGRVIYGYQGEQYKTVNTDLTAAENAGVTIEGHIPAGDAVFTQTATLRQEEKFAVSPRTVEKQGEAYGSMSPVMVTVSRAGTTRAEGDGQPDVLQLSAVEADKARTDYDLGGDGVKWLSGADVPQIYAVQGGGRYSLLSAVSVEGKVAVGVSVAEPGMYTIAVPDDCLADGYETVTLEDAQTRRSVNLLDGGYDFTTNAPGCIEGRFTISFNRMAGDIGGGIRAYCTSPGVVRVEGVEPGDDITVYSADGMMAARRMASSTVEEVEASVAAVAIVKVERDGETISTVKLTMKN